MLVNKIFSQFVMLLFDKKNQLFYNSEHSQETTFFTVQHFSIILMYNAMF